jgi:enoyl-CoA hydratase/carnithine racemase
MTTGDNPALLLDKRGQVLWLTLNRPRVLNAYNIEMRDELYEALGLIAEDPDIQVAVFRGAGDRAFCAGADLTEFGTAPSQAIARRVRFQRDLWARFLALRKPLIAAIHGYCLGSGLEIALCCDVRLSTPDAQFGLPETALGMIPAAAATQTLPRAIGTGRALDLLLTGHRISGLEAHRGRLVNRLSPYDRLFEDTQALGDRLAVMPPSVLAAAKDAMLRGLDTDLAAGLAIEWTAATMESAAKRV